MHDYPNCGDVTGYLSTASMLDYTQQTLKQEDTPSLAKPLKPSTGSGEFSCKAISSPCLVPSKRPVSLDQQQDLIAVYRYLKTHAKLLPTQTGSIWAVQVSLDRIADESIREYHPTYKKPSLRRRVAQILKDLETQGVLTIVRSPQWKQVNTYVLHKAQQSDSDQADNLDDPSWITISRSDHVLVCSNSERERERINRDPHKSLSKKRIEEVTEKNLHWEVNVNPLPPQVHHSLPGFLSSIIAIPNKPGSWNGDATSKLHIIPMTLQEASQSLAQFIPCLVKRWVSVRFDD